MSSPTVGLCLSPTQHDLSNAMIIFMQNFNSNTFYQFLSICFIHFMMCQNDYFHPLAHSYI